MGSRVNLSVVGANERADEFMSMVGHDEEMD